MTLWLELLNKKYLHPRYLVVSNNPHSNSDFNCDNYHLFTAHAYMMVNFTLWPNYTGEFLPACEIDPGRYRRHPDVISDTSQEELMGQATMSPKIAKEILDYGDKHWWVFRTDGSKFVWSVQGFKNLWACFKLRFVWLRPYVKFCAYGEMAPHDEVLWCICLWRSAKSEYGNTESKLYFHTMTKVMQRNPSEVVQFFIRNWRKEMQAKYPGGPNELFSVFFKQPDHPFRTFAGEKF